MRLVYVYAGSFFFFFFLPFVLLFASLFIPNCRKPEISQWWGALCSHILTLDSSKKCLANFRMKKHNANLYGLFFNYLRWLINDMMAFNRCIFANGSGSTEFRLLGRLPAGMRISLTHNQPTILQSESKHGIHIWRIAPFRKYSSSIRRYLYDKRNLKVAVWLKNSSIAHFSRGHKQCLWTWHLSSRALIIA